MTAAQRIQWREELQGNGDTEVTAASVTGQVRGFFASVSFSRLQSGSLDRTG